MFIDPEFLEQLLVARGLKRDEARDSIKRAKRNLPPIKDLESEDYQYMCAELEEERAQLIWMLKSIRSENGEDTVLTDVIDKLFQELDIA